MKVTLDVDGPAAPPRLNGELVFDAPWQGRAMGLAVTTVQNLGLDWDDFRQRLIAAIAAFPDRPYWESWVVALEDLVADCDLTSLSDNVSGTSATD